MPVHRSLLAPELARHHAHHGAVVVGDFRNVRRLDVLISRIHHLLMRRQVGPELEAVHAPFGIALRHFLVHDAAARGHPLHVARAQRAFVPQAVAVVHGALEHVGDGLDAAVRVPGESLEEVLGALVAEVVEQEEGVELLGLPEPEGATKLHSGAFQRGRGFDDSLHRSDRHLSSMGPAPRNGVAPANLGSLARGARFRRIERRSRPPVPAAMI